MSDFGRLRSYDRFLIPVHALVWTASISRRDANFSQLQTRRYSYLGIWVVPKACEERRGGFVWSAIGVQNSTHLGASVTFTMPFTFSFEEYADMIYMYGFCYGNSVLAVAEYQQRFPNRRIPNWRVFTGIYQALRDTGRRFGVRIAAERGVNEGVNEEGIVRMVHCSPRTSRQRNSRRLRVPQTRVWRTLHAEGMYPYHVQRVQHLLTGDFAEWLNFCNWPNGSRQFIVTSFLQTKRNLIATVSIIHTILMCVEMRIPALILKTTFNNVSVVMCGVQFWTIS